MKKGVLIGLVAGIVYCIAVFLSVNAIVTGSSMLSTFFWIIISFTIIGSLGGLIVQKIRRYWLKNFLIGFLFGVLSATIYWFKYFATFLSCIFDSSPPWLCSDSADIVFIVFEFPFKIIYRGLEAALNTFGSHNAYAYTVMGVNGEYGALFDVLITVSGIMVYIFVSVLFGWFYSRFITKQ